MKRINCVLALICLCTVCFADIIIQTDYEGIGFSAYELGGNCNPQITPRKGSEFTTFNGFTLSSVLYEFNSDRDEPVHFYTGFDAGFCNMGAAAFAVGGYSITSPKFGNCVLDINTVLKLGGCFGITNDFYPSAQIDSVFTFMKADRKGPFAGVGITNQIIDLTFPSLSKDDYYIENYAGLIFTAGWRF